MYKELHGGPAGTLIALTISTPPHQTPTNMDSARRQSEAPRKLSLTTGFAAPVMDEKVTTQQNILEDVQNEIENYGDVVDGARNATQFEKRMTLKEGLRRYPKAVAWSFLLSTAM